VFIEQARFDVPAQREEPSITERRTHRTFVTYIDKSREYYAAQGYEKPYGWAHLKEVPFTPLPKPFAQCRIGVATNADLEGRAGPRTTVQRPEVWDRQNDQLWRDRFMRVDDTNRAALASAGEARRREQAARTSA